MEMMIFFINPENVVVFMECYSIRGCTCHDMSKLVNG